MAKQPAILFYPGDWMKAPEVRCLSYAAKGLWFDMLCLMAEAKKRGVLEQTCKQNGKQILARMTGGTVAEVESLLEEMRIAGTFSVNDDGAIICRRMVREAEISQMRAEAGRKGGLSHIERAKQNAEQEPLKSQASLEDEDEDEEKRIQEKKDIHPAGEKSHPREQDLIWNSVCSIFHLNPQTKSEKSRVGKIVADLKIKNATAAEIQTRLTRYKKQWPNAAATPEALTKHWDTLTGSASESPISRLRQLEYELAQAEKSERHYAAARLRDQIAKLKEASMGAPA